jgi:Mrp family chromosome partitioning ATPase
MSTRQAMEYPLIDTQYQPAAPAEFPRPFSTNMHSAYGPAASLDLNRFPALTRSRRWDQNSSVFEVDPEGVAAVQFRLMQRRLTNQYRSGGLLLITSPGPGDGKSLTAQNLAWAFAEAGSKTLLLELDMRRPTQARRFGATLLMGTADILSGKASPLDVLRRVEGVPLGFIGLEHPAKDSISLLRSDALPKLLSWAKSAFTWVVIDVPPILPVADVEELLPSVDLVALVVRERVTPRRLASRAVERLGIRLDFTILNGSQLSEADGYGYSYK